MSIQASPKRSIIGILAIVLCWSTANGQGSPWTVDDDGPADFSNIQDAIDVATHGDTIEVMPGTYYGTGSLGEPVVDMQGKSLHLLGLPEGNNRVVVDGNNKQRCLGCASNEDAKTIIESIDFRNGYADRGGGLYCLGSSPSLMDCVFETNTSTDRGGGIYIEGGSPNLENCIVTNNNSAYGGGFYIRESLANITGGLVAGNQGSSRGGGFRIVNASPQVSDVQVESNWAVRGGGGHIQENSAPTFNNCIIMQNTADSLGGGMAHSSSSPAVYLGCTFSENTATGNNGGQGSGGAVYCDGSAVVLQSCNLQDNQAATYGAGVYCWYSSPILAGTVIQNNVAGNSGGAIRTINGNGPNLLINNLLCQNTPDNIAGPWDGIGTNNCIGDSCDDEDLDGIIDACDDDIIPTLEVPNEYATVQDAYDAAEEGNVILVHPGTHVVSTINGSVGLLMEEKGVILRSVSGPSDTILTRTTSGRIITCYDLPDTAVIEGFTITGGQTTFSSGIALNNSDVRFNNCIIEGNNSAFGAGFAAVASSEPILTECLIQNNESITQGAGVWAWGSSHVTLIYCDVDNNIVVSGEGAGLCANDADLTLKNTGVRNNQFLSGGDGAGAYISGNGTLLAEDSNFKVTYPELDAEVYVDHGALAIFSEGSGIDAITTDNSGTRIQFVADSFTDVTSDIIPPEDGAMIMEIGELVSGYPILLCTGNIVQQGCLTLTNPSGTLLESNVGDYIDLITTWSFSYNGGTVVFPPMPVGLGLQITEGSDQPRSGYINMGVEVIEVDTPEFNDPFTGSLDAPPIDMVAIDVDNDGQEELAVLFDGSPGSVWVYDISEDAPPVAIAGFTTFVGNAPTDLDAGDLDGDGDDDLIIANAADQTITVLETLESTFVVSTVSLTSGNPTCTAIIDWDGNGSLDAVVGVDAPGAASDGFQIILDIHSAPVQGNLFNTDSYFNGLSSEPNPPTTVSGGGSFTSWGFTGGTRFGGAYYAQQGDTSLTEIASIGGQRITQITAQDLDANGGDGRLDIILASDEAELLFIIPGTPNGFNTPIPIMVAEPVVEFVALDADDDGDVDLIITCPEANGVPLLLLRNDEPGSSIQSLNGRIWSKQALGNDSPLIQLASGALDPKDEDDDWVLGSGAPSALNGTSTTMEQTTFLPSPTPCPGDFNGDQVVSIDDMLIVIGNFGGTGQGDGNDDGIVNIEDLLIVLDAFGQTCTGR